MRPILACCLLLATSAVRAEESPPADPLHWQQLPALPDRMGFGGAAAGVSNYGLIVAGGSNFPARPVWGGGVKKWYDDIYLLPTLDKRPSSPCSASFTA